MGLFSFLFGNAGEADSAGVSQDAHHKDNIKWEGGSLKYDATLISKLKQDHQALLAQFAEIQQARQQQDYVGVQKRLHDFKMLLSAHLLAENVRFYAYVKRGLAHDPHNFQIMADFWKEMQGIGKVVMQFLDKYETSVFTPELKASFETELAAIGEALVGRIRHEEESLYTLYQPSYGH